MAQNTEYIYDGNGGISHARPKAQDIKPKAFQFPATNMIFKFETPSERRLLWMIAHYPYIQWVL